MPRMRAPTSTRTAFARGPCTRLRRHYRPCRPFEKAEQSIGNEARSRRIDMPIALRVLPMREEALRHDEVKIVLGARHGDIEQAALLLDLGRDVPVPRSEGMQPSTTLSTKTDFHSWPLAEWIVERIR